MQTFRYLYLLSIFLTLLSTPAHSEETAKAQDPAVFCAKMWPDDFVMQKHCITKQRDAIKKMAEEFTRLVKQEKRMEEQLYYRIVGRCMQQMGQDDAALLEHCTRKQIEAYFSLKADQP